jgi:hypothetical protein
VKKDYEEMLEYVEGKGGVPWGACVLIFAAR